MSPRIIRRQGRPYVVYSLRERAAMELRDRAGEVMRWDATTLALAAVAYPRDLLAMLRARFYAWTALPGDRFRDIPRAVEGEVLGGRPGHAVVRVVTDEARVRGSGTSRIERDVDLSRWWKL